MSAKRFGVLVLIVFPLLIGWHGETYSASASAKGKSQATSRVEKGEGLLASKASRIIDVRLEKKDDSLEVTIIGDGEIGKFETLKLGKPTRFVLDIREVTLRLQKSMIRNENALIKEVRIGRHPEKVRFVFYPHGNEIPAYEIKPERGRLRVVFAGSSKGTKEERAQGQEQTEPLPHGSRKTEAVTREQVEQKRVAEPSNQITGNPSATGEAGKGGEDQATKAQAPEPATPPAAGPASGEEAAPIRISIRDLGPKPVPPDVMSLEEAVKIALERNLRIHSAKEQVRASEFRTKAAFADFLPKWTAQYAYTHYSKPVFIDYVLLSKKNPLTGDLVSVPGTDRDVFNLGTGASLPLFTGGALSAAYQLEKLGVDISKWNVDIAKLDIVLQARVNYFNILTAERAIEVARQAVKQFESQLEVSKAFFEVGLVAKNDVLQAEVRLANAVQALVTAENALALTKASFNTLLRRPIDTPVQVVDILEYKPHGFRFEDAVEEALRQRPEIKAAQLTVEQAKEAVKIAKAGFYPTVSLAGSYSTSSEEPSLLGDLRGHSWSAQAVASFTLFEWGKTAYKVAESKVKVNQAEDAKTQLVEQIVLEVKQNYLNMLNAEKNIGVAQKSLEQAEENLRINEERYKYQVATQTEVLDAVALLAQARQNYYLALSAYHIAKAQLERSMGRTKIPS